MPDTVQVGEGEMGPHVAEDPVADPASYGYQPPHGTSVTKPSNSDILAPGEEGPGKV